MDRLIIDSAKSADQIYASDLSLSAPFITLVRGKKRYLAAGGFEYPQAKAKWPTTRFEDLGKTRDAIIKAFLKKHSVKTPYMSSTTGASAYRLVPGAKLVDTLFPERAIKNKTEIKHIKNAQKANENAIAAVRNILAQAKVLNGKAKYKNAWLTSEFLKRIAAVELAKHNCSCPDMIISSGTQTRLPHDQGSGIIKEGVVIVDIFPRSNESHYYADCTRTYVIGKAPKLFDERYAAVLQVQKEAMKKITHNAEGVEKWSHERFAQLGFATDYAKGTGYIHSLGHGVGLDIHENPRFSSQLKAGNVLTVEPGLYYDYGIRIEDIGVVTKNGFTNFSKLSKEPYL